MTALGVGLYGATIVTMTRLAPPGPAARLRAAWLAGAVCMVVAALAYKGSPLAGGMRETIIEAVKEVGLASLPLWFLAVGLARRADAQTSPLTRSWVWIAGAVVILAAFVATMGRGLP
jgi:hypothetical protein